MWNNILIDINRYCLKLNISVFIIKIIVLIGFLVFDMNIDCEEDFLMFEIFYLVLV